MTPAPLPAPPRVPAFVPTPKREGDLVMVGSGVVARFRRVVS